MAHPHGDPASPTYDPSAPLFPEMRLDPPASSRATLATLTVAEAEERLVLDWATPLRHGPFYQLVFRPAVLRANRLTPTAALSAQLKFHGLRHTYASLCIKAGIPPLDLSRFMGHTNVTITLGVYAHQFADDHADAMAALGASPAKAKAAGNVVPLRGKAVGTS